MAQQGTEEKTGSTGDEGAAQQPAAEETTGKHAAPSSEEAATSSSGTAASSSEATTPSSEAASSSEASSSEASSGTAASTEQAPAQAKAEESAPAESKTEKVAPAEPKTEKVEKPAPAEAEHPRHRSVDVGELAWRTGNVLATVVRTLALLFALVLVVNVVLVLVGVNPANGVAQFVSGVANIVIVGFRDLFIPTNPVLMLVVNSLVAAVFWVFVGELVSRLIRFVAARVK